jgi:molybdopterin molybdotransferase
MPAERAADWLSVRDARARILRAVSPLSSESRGLLDCLGFVLAEELRSPLDLPPWDNSAMDGFAVRAADVRGASADSPIALPVAGDLPAGASPAGPLAPGTAVRIMTGAPVPDGADTVVRVEHTSAGARDGSNRDIVRVNSDADAGRNIRGRGEEIRLGDVALATESVLGPGAIGLAASLGRSDLSVVRRPVVAVLTSGDELVDVDRFDEVLAGRAIVSSNSYTLASQIREMGMDPRLLGTARDDPADLRRRLEQARGCDALITSAGISMGDRDLMHGALDDFGVRLEFWRVKMRPGSPFAFGVVGDLGGIPWFGLPGNPVSSMVTFEVLVKPALLRMAGHAAIYEPTVHATLDDDYPAAPGLSHFARVTLRDDGGAVHASLTGAQGSGILTSMAAADALLVIDETSSGAAGGDRLPAIILGGRPLREMPGY